MSLSKAQVSEYRRLKDSGVEVSDTNRVCFNEGSETAPHVSLKALAGLVGIRNGYRVDSEVPIDNTEYENGETDVLLWGHESRLTYAVEIETSIAPGTKNRKLDKYVRETAIDDMQIINVTQAPSNMVDAFGFVASELGISP